MSNAPHIARIIGAAILVATPFTTLAADDLGNTPETGLKTTGVETTLLSTPSPAQEVINPGIGRLQAKAIARQHLRHMGFTRPGKSMVTAAVTGLTKVGDSYRADFLFGANLPSEHGSLTIDAASGAIIHSSFRY